MYTQFYSENNHNLKL